MAGNQGWIEYCALGFEESPRSEIYNGVGQWWESLESNLERKKKYWFFKK